MERRTPSSQGEPSRATVPAQRPRLRSAAPAPAPRARRLLHHAYAATGLGLLATGFLICAPEARAHVLGGFGRELLHVHVVLGVALVALPVSALALAGSSLLAELRRRLGPPDPPWTWKKLHLAATLVLGVLLVVSGLLLWLAPGLPLRLYDAVLAVHHGSTWVFAALVPVHLIAARRKIAARAAMLLGAAPPPLHEDDEGHVLEDA